MATTTVTTGIQILQASIYTRSFFYGTTAQTVVVNLSKAGAAFAAAAGTVTEIANGWYKVALTSVDTGTLGDLAYHCTAGAGGPADFNDQIVAQTFQQLSINPSGLVTAAGTLRQNQALNAFPFVMTSGGVPKTGLAITAQRSLGGAGFAPCVNTPTELGNGCYVINLAASDLNSPTVTLRLTASGADDNDIFLVLQP